MHVTPYARAAAFVLSFLLGAVFGLAACTDDGGAVIDGGMDAGGACVTDQDCDDQNPCTTDGCDAELGCLHVPADADHDGYTEGVCTGASLRGGDCNDMNETVYPGAPELCDELDNDCDEMVDDETVEVPCTRDADGDGYGLLSDTVRACNCPDGYIPPRSNGKFDCYDENTDVNPSHTEFTAPGYCPVALCDFSQLEYDFDCNGEEEEEYPTSSDGSCRFVNVGGILVCRGSGWVLNVPFCGDSGSYRSCDSLDGCSETIVDSQRQGCR